MGDAQAPQVPQQLPSGCLWNQTLLSASPPQPAHCSPIPHPPETTYFYLPAAAHLNPFSFTLCLPRHTKLEP